MKTHFFKHLVATLNVFVADKLLAKIDSINSTAED